uniref:Uncharacterized protein n=1 Tax=Rhizophora mucronata TaxID=61149 RepID=A0A2P2QTZ5_RHIMU
MPLFLYPSLCITTRSLCSSSLFLWVVGWINFDWLLDPNLVVARGNEKKDCFFFF